MKVGLCLQNEVGEHESFIGGKKTRSNAASGCGARGPKSHPCHGVVLDSPTHAAQGKLKIQRQNLNLAFFGWICFSYSC